ncbi:MAG TPA: NAD-dependent epimerase/dehydratase family protein [Rhizomicrobium sp.]|nr:NAD-dependent epimerase/dehydratase family protein [Rhizomicrobium sp.]
MIYVIGGNGFVGAAYVRLLQTRGLPHRAITRENYESLRGTACDVLINANGNSKKFLAAREPLNEFDQSVRSVAQSLQDFRWGTYIQLSTGDVYPDQSSPQVTREDQAIDPARQSRYGLHKCLAEQLVRGVCEKWLVIRMGGFVGPGLKKNAIFDMLTGAPVWLSPQSELQFLSTDRAAALVWELAQKGVSNEIVNLGATGTVNLGALHRRIGSASSFMPQAPTVCYDVSLDKLAKLSGTELPRSLDEVEKFIATWKA